MLIIFEHGSSKAKIDVDDRSNVSSCLSSDDQTHGFEYYGGTWLDRVTTGTAHLSVVGTDGDAVALTSTVNL